MAERDTVRIFLFITFLIALGTLILAIVAFSRSATGHTGPTGPPGIATSAPIVISNTNQPSTPSIAAGGIFVLSSNFVGTLTVDAPSNGGTVGALVIITVLKPHNNGHSLLPPIFNCSPVQPLQVAILHLTCYLVNLWPSTGALKVN